MNEIDTEGIFVCTKTKRYYDFQTWLVKNTEIYNKPQHVALKIVLEELSKLIKSDRFGIWFLSPNKESLFEEITLQNGTCTSGGIIHRKDFPLYFSQIHNTRVIQASRVENSSILMDEFEKYFKILEINSLLDAPIFSDGELIGILCLESIHSVSDWDGNDQMFIASCADFIGRFIEAEKRHSYENELKHRINHLELNLKRRIDELNEAKISLDIALQSAKAAKWEWEVETNHCFYNDTWFENLGYRPNELPSMLSTFKQVLYPGDADRVFNEINSYLEGERSIYECRFRLVTKTGEIKWFLDRGCITQRNFDGSPNRLTGIIIDITPFVKLEETKRLSEQQLKLMIESIPTPVVMLDKDFNVIARSSKWQEDWGSNSIGEFSQNGWVKIIGEALEGKSLSSEQDFVEFSNGECKWLKWVIKPWVNSHNQISGVIMMVENITERKDAEIKLAQSSKLSALGEMAGGIAHEINNPLSIIKGYVDLLKRLASRDDIGQETLTSYLFKIDRTIERISKIVGGMRRFARESSNDEKIKYSLNKIVDETLDICFEKLNNNGIHVDVVLAEKEPFVHCRPIEISQVLLNLINNAFHAVCNQTNASIRVQILDAQKNYQLIVSDNGPGISQSVKQKLFQPFFTTKEIGAGTGLGLSISKGIVEDHQGKLYLTENFRDTAFVIELPRLENLS